MDAGEFVGWWWRGWEIELGLRLGMGGGGLGVRGEKGGGGKGRRVMGVEKVGDYSVGEVGAEGFEGGEGGFGDCLGWGLVC